MKIEVGDDEVIKEFQEVEDEEFKVQVEEVGMKNRKNECGVDKSFLEILFMNLN